MFRVGRRINLIRQVMLIVKTKSLTVLSDNQMVFIIIRTTILNTAFPLAIVPEVHLQEVHALPHSSLLEAQGCQIKPYCDLPMWNGQETRFLLFCSSCLHPFRWARERKCQYALKEICPNFHCIMINLILCMSLTTLDWNEKTNPGNLLRHQYYHSNSIFPHPFSNLSRSFLGLWTQKICGSLNILRKAYYLHWIIMIFLRFFLYLTYPNQSLDTNQYHSYRRFSLHSQISELIQY